MERHPYRNDTGLIQINTNKLLLYLLLVSLSFLFLGLSAAYLYQRFEKDIPVLQLPLIFVFNSLILLASSYFIHRANKAYLNDDTEAYTRSLTITLLLTLLFMIAQYIGWTYMRSQDLWVNTGPATAYLYIISALHFLHVFGGLPFLGLFIYTARRRMKDPVSVLIYFSNPDKRLKLRLLTIYWHFLDALWIYLVLFFFVVSLT